MNCFILGCYAKRDVQSQISRLGHFQRHEIPNKPSRNDASRSFKRNCAFRPYDPVCKTCEATRAIATHFRFSAISIKVAHPKIRAVRRFFEQQNPIGADSPVAIAKVCDLAAIKMNVARAIVDQDEIVSRAVHFCETQHPFSSSIVYHESQLALKWRLLSVVMSSGVEYISHCYRIRVRDSSTHSTSLRARLSLGMTQSCARCSERSYI